MDSSLIIFGKDRHIALVKCLVYNYSYKKKLIWTWTWQLTSLFVKIKRTPNIITKHVDKNYPIHFFFFLGIKHFINLILLLIFLKKKNFIIKKLKISTIVKLFLQNTYIRFLLIKNKDLIFYYNFTTMGWKDLNPCHFHGKHLDMWLSYKTLDILIFRKWVFIITNNLILLG